MRRRRENLNSEQSSVRDRWLISYADLITLLLGLFIVLYAASDKERAQMVAKSFENASHGKGILDGGQNGPADGSLSERLITNELLTQKTKMTRSKEGVVISLSEAGFFAPGEAAIGPNAEDVILTIARSLHDDPTHIRIEGHTDSTPISNARYPSNWELSTARASTVLARLIENGIAPERLSAAGYAGFQPVQDNSTSEGRAQNRRVDIVILTAVDAAKKILRHPKVNLADVDKNSMDAIGVRS